MTYIPTVGGVQLQKKKQYWICVFLSSACTKKCGANPAILLLLSVLYTSYLAVDPVLHDLPEERPVLLQHVGALQVVAGVRLVQGQAHHLVPNNVFYTAGHAIRFLIRSIFLT